MRNVSSLLAALLPIRNLVATRCSTLKLLSGLETEVRAQLNHELVPPRTGFSYKGRTFEEVSPYPEANDRKAKLLKFEQSVLKFLSYLP